MNQHTPYDSLLDDFLSGNREAFGVIYKSYWQSLFEMAFRRLSDEQQAEDVVQDVFVNLWEKRGTIQIDNLEAYLKTSVRNRIFNLVTKDKVKNSYYAHIEKLAFLGSRADDSIEYRELWERYQQVLSELPAGQQQVFKLRFEDDLPTQDIAGRLNITQKTVQNQLLKAMNRVKSIFMLLLWALLQ